MARSKKKPDPVEAPDSLEAEVRALRQELTFLREHQMFRVYQSVRKVLLFRLAIGMATGLGTVVGATLLLSVIIWMLSQIAFVPILGDFSAQMAQRIQEAVSGDN
jgi:hypothetical protein